MPTDSVIWGSDGTPATVVIDGITYRVARVDGNGALRVALDVDADDLRAVNKAYSSAQTHNELIAAPGSGLSIYIASISFSTELAGRFTLHESASLGTPRFGPHFFPDNGGMSTGRLSPPIKCTANTHIAITTDIAGEHTIDLGAFVAP